MWGPRVVIVGWAPYRFGPWTWISPWGWTWIDHASWGFAPFHFGRWVFVRHRWCWVPGPRHRRPVFAPAHVAWRGTPHDGGRVHGAASWLPLGPRDIYVPRHPASPRYLRNVNISNTVIDNNALITNAARNRMQNLRFANRDAPDVVTTLPGSAFEAHRAATDRFLRANPREFARRSTAPLYRGAARVPTERRAIQSNSNRPPPLPAERQVGRRGIESDGNRTRDHDDLVHIARRFDRPPTGVRTEPPRTLRAEPEQRTQSPRASSPQPRALSQPSRSSHQHTSRSSRSDEGSRGRSSVQVRSSDQSQRAASAEPSQSSMSRGQSGRAGFRTNRR
ncbi:MAG: DUF6600 domain-containing protein [Gammaproteobacteria bacterium]